jgi:hypothetical protein
VFLVLFVGSYFGDRVSFSLNLSRSHLGFTVVDELDPFLVIGNHCASVHSPLLINSVISCTEQVVVVLQVLDLFIIITLLHCSIQNLEGAINTRINQLLVHHLSLTSGVLSSSSSFIQFILMVVMSFLNITLFNEGVVDVLESIKVGNAIEFMVLIGSLHEGVVVKAKDLQVIFEVLQVVDRFL